MPNTEFDAQVWPPIWWCGVVNPERTHICDQPRHHDGDHEGPELPTIEIDDPAYADERPGGVA